MLSSMFSGVSGLTAHQVKMDVIGNNIANVNTTAFKSSSVTFAELFSQTVQAATQPTDSLGGTNAQQVGLGVSVGGISVLYGGGSIQSTGNPNDLAIDGEGFFIVSDGTSQHYTRAGNFNIDVNGNLVTSSGSKVLGWNLASGESVNTTDALEAINLYNITMAAKPTSQISVIGNINSTTELYDSANDANYTLCDLTVFDSLGESHTLTLKIMKTDANEYEYEVMENDGNMAITAGATGGEIIFDGSGKLSSATTPALTLTFTNGAADITIDSADIVFDASGLTQYANETRLVASQNGYTSGSLTDYSIDSSGTIMGVFSNGKQQAVAVIAMATFSNMSGLVKVGNNEYVSSWNSGDAQIGLAGTGTRGKIATYSLEMSNVDLANEFTEMIVAQRGFQANSRIITTSDQLLEELVNLKR